MNLCCINLFSVYLDLNGYPALMQSFNLLFFLHLDEEIGRPENFVSVVILVLYII